MGPYSPAGLKAHTHEDRVRIAIALIPLIQRYMGKQLIALAATGSFALESDQPYSGLDFICFVRNAQYSGRAKIDLIYNGLLIHLRFIKRREYIDIHRHNVREEWAYAAAEILVPLINEPFIRALSEELQNTDRPQYGAAILKLWPAVQEAAGKVMDAVISHNDEAVSYLYWSMVEKISVILALLNRRQFSTRAKMFSEACTFSLLPRSYPTLFSSPCESDTSELGKRTRIIFAETEQLLERQGLLHYADSLDCFVKLMNIRKPLRQRPLSQKLVRAVDLLKQKVCISR